MKLGWYSGLTALEKRTYWACFGGFALDSMDTTIYALVMPVLISVVGITRPEAGVLASASLIGSAVGGWGAGILADRIGRGGPQEVADYLNFLKGGCSKDPLDLLRDAGVDMQQPGAVDDALAQFGRLVEELDALV